MMIKTLNRMMVGWAKRFVWTSSKAYELSNNMLAIGETVAVRQAQAARAGNQDFKYTLHRCWALSNLTRTSSFPWAKP